MLITSLKSTFSLATLVTLLTLQSVSAQTTTPIARRDSPLTAVTDGNEVLTKLMQGNQRYVSGAAIAPDRTSATKAATAESQRPMAIILSCADSRVAPEIFLDQGVGDLFVVRVAGNILTTEGQASIEYAVAVLGAPLILVLGHENCGAVDAAIKAYEKGATFPGEIGSLVDHIEPAVAITSATKSPVPLHDAIETNVTYVMDQCKVAGQILPKAIAGGKLVVAGGVYNLKTGKVELLK